jgi:hypothetical protein
MNPELIDGWVCFPYSGHDTALVEMQAGSGPRRAAFLDWANGYRVAKLRPASLRATGTVTVKLYVNGVQASSGRVTV